MRTADGVSIYCRYAVAKYPQAPWGCCDKCDDLYNETHDNKRDHKRNGMPLDYFFALRDACSSAR